MPTYGRSVPTMTIRRLNVIFIWNPMKGTTGGIVEKEMPIHVSNVAVFNPATQKGERVSIKTLDDGRKVRVFRTNGEMLDA